MDSKKEETEVNTVTKTSFILACSFLSFSSNAATIVSEKGESFSNTQSIQVINLLANTNLTDPGMTATPVIVKYYNGNGYPCWVSTLNYQNDTTVHAGPGLGCVAKITEVIVSPVDVADKLKTYKGPMVVSIDPSKFAYQITIVQEAPPIFDSQSGLVSKQGTMKYNIQSMYR